jgi:hypothetical protein
MRTKAEVTADLKQMLGDVFAAKEAGQSYARLARAHGYVDGYMRALLDLEVLSKTELLGLVTGERTRTSGPALRTLTSAPDLVELEVGAA